RRAGFGLDVRDRLAHLARPPEPLAALETPPELFNANPDVKLRALFDEEGGQDASRLGSSQVGHKALRGVGGPEPEGTDDRAERDIREVLHLHDPGQKGVSGLERGAHERDQVALDGGETGERSWCTR